jgi:exosortase A-associated hydrolase 2
MQTIGEFIPVDEGRAKILLTAHLPQSFAGKCVVVAAPFAEEMNKARHAYSRLAQALATQRTGVLVVDYRGTGDSEGDFAHGSVSGWKADLRAAIDWAAARGWQITGLLGVRFGASLIVEMLQDLEGPRPMVVFWHPQLDGSRVLEQFLRLRVAASLMGDAKETTGQLRARLRSGETIEIAGYNLSPLMASELEALAPLKRELLTMSECHWVEVLRAPEADVSAASARNVLRLTDLGVDVRVHRVVADQFWISTELVDMTPLVETTSRILNRDSHE